MTLVLERSSSPATTEKFVRTKAPSSPPTNLASIFHPPTCVRLNSALYVPSDASVTGTSATLPLKVETCTASA